MTQEDFRKQIEWPFRANNKRVIDASSYEEAEFHRSYGITLRAVVARTIRLSLENPKQAQEYYDTLAKAIMDMED